MLLSMSEMAYLARIYEDSNDMSPFTTFRGEPMQGNEAVTLQDKGVLQGAKPHPDMLPLLDTLAQPDRFGRVMLSSFSGIVERIAYGKDDMLTIFSGKPEGMATTDITKALQDYAAIIPPAEEDIFGLEISLPCHDALTLLALLDLRRFRGLRSYLGESLEPLAEAKLKEYLQGSHPNGFYRMVTEAFALSAPRDWRQSVASLRDARLVEPDSLALDDDLQLISHIMMLPDAFISMESIDRSATETTSFASFAVYSGNTALAFFRGGDRLDIHTLGGNSLLQAMGAVLQCPPLADDTGAATSPDEWLCSCGKRNTSKFCLKCGAKRPGADREHPRFCADCGADMKPDSKFCSECGRRV